MSHQKTTRTASQRDIKLSSLIVNWVGVLALAGMILGGIALCKGTTAATVIRFHHMTMTTQSVGVALVIISWAMLVFVFVRVLKDAAEPEMKPIPVPVNSRRAPPPKGRQL